MTLSKDEMNIDDLAAKAQNGDIEAYTLLFKGAKGVMYKLARKYSLNEDTYEDLVSLGLVLFCETLKKFDSSKGKFTTRLWDICRYRFISHSVRNQQYSVKVPTYLTELAVKLRRFKSEFSKKEFREPTDEECIGFLGVTEKRYKNVKNVECTKEKICLDKVVWGISGNTTETEAINKIMISTAINESNLTSRENEVIQALYFYGFSVVELSTILGISRTRIYELKDKALKKMRKRLM